MDLHKYQTNVNQTHVMQSLKQQPLESMKYRPFSEDKRINLDKSGLCQVTGQGNKV